METKMKQLKEQAELYVKHFSLDRFKKDYKAVARNEEQLGQAIFLAGVSQSSGDYCLSLGLYAAFIYPIIKDTSKVLEGCKVSSLISPEDTSIVDYKIEYKGGAYYAHFYNTLPLANREAFTVIPNATAPPFAELFISCREDAPLFDHPVEREVLRLFKRNKRVELNFSSLVEEAFSSLDRHDDIRLISTRYGLNFLGDFKVVSKG